MTAMKLKMAAGAACILALTMSAPTAAQAQAANYDGYCYAKQGDAKTTGTVVGAVAGGAVGSQVSKNERGLGTVAGAVIGGVIGRNIGKNSVKCYNGEYYSYQNGSYTPDTAPDGYVPVYYQSRPDVNAYSKVYYDPQRRSTSPNDRYAYNSSYNQNGYNNGYNQGSYGNAYNSRNSQQGWRDDRGQWHLGRPVAFGWRDERGQWHEGQLQTYGWRDDRGGWHETDTRINGGYSGGGN